MKEWREIEKEGNGGEWAYLELVLPGLCGRRGIEEIDSEDLI